jgi:orotidine-5'-phosphate decarboxylase
MNMTNEVSAELKSRLALALDVDDLVAATRLSRKLAPWFGVAKVGLELYTAAGPDAIAALVNQGYDVFCDLKLHDIPNTVGRSARVLGALGVRYATFHTHGGVDMLKAGAEGLSEGASSAGLGEPTSLGVTVLTSDDTAPPHIVPKRLKIAVEGGCGGIVCAAGDLPDARTIAPRLVRVVPGIRPVGAPQHDQARSATPREALDGGADMLVIGRAITAAEDPEQAAAALVNDL